ncbi:MAG TPA: hypothetical protein VJZ00_02045 [Thermoanaerobaculia bacterium]|nr:hypothetical protein [Thermoanaerobaculia bacterium]
MTTEEILSLIDGCLKYMRSTTLPTPLPTNPIEYIAWRAQAAASRDVDEDAEDAWFELDRLVAEEPNVGWEILSQLATRCDDADMCAQLAAGPLNTFLHAHGDTFSQRVEEELAQNAGLRTAYNWLRN